MYKNAKIPSGGISCNEATEGKSIERMLEKALSEKTPIEGTAPIEYSEKNKGCQPEYDIRTDKFEIALAAVEKMNESRIAKRKYALEKQAEEAKKEEKAEADNA